MTAEIGCRVIRELPNLVSKIVSAVADLDIEGTYPNVQSICNLSRETTYRELCDIAGVNKQTQAMIGVNLTAGTINAVEICMAAYKLPDQSTFLRAFREDLARAA